MTDGRVVLVTGASSGIGQATAVLLARAGYKVYGTSRSPGEHRMASFELIQLDVTSQESVAACVHHIVEQVGRIDVLVNNAGMEIVGAAEELSLDEYQKIFDTNFFGVVRMTQAVLPMMRRQARGHIINIASGLGLASLPIMGAYSATKFALEGWSESLRYEVAPFNIHVATVEPGFYQTQIRERKLITEHPIKSYAALRQHMVSYMDQQVAGGGDPHDVAQVILNIVEQKAPGFRHPVSPLSTLLAWSRRFAPYSVMERGMRVAVGLEDWRPHALRASAVAVSLALFGVILKLGDE